MGIRTVCSSEKNIEELVSDLRKQARGFDTKMLVYFASASFDPESLSRGMKRAFGNASVFGCSTAGEIVSGKILRDSVVGMLFDADTVEDVRIEVVGNVRSENRIPEAFRAFEAYYRMPVSEMDFEKYVGIILPDGMSCAEEKLMEKIGDLSNLTFIGGSAGDDLRFEATHVYADGKAYTDAALLALIRLTRGFDVIKTQSFRATDKELTATKVDEARRAVLEFDHRPAARAYAEALGITPEHAPGYFTKHPVGLMFGDEPYVRSPQRIQDGAMRFYCKIKEGMKLSVLTSGDIVEDTRKAVEDKKNSLGRIAGILNFNCVLRSLELEKQNQLRAYEEIFSDIPTIGFSTYGEAFIGHINQTSTMLLFR